MDLARIIVGFAASQAAQAASIAAAVRSVEQRLIGGGGGGGSGSGGGGSGSGGGGAGTSGSAAAAVVRDALQTDQLGAGSGIDSEADVSYEGADAADEGTAALLAAIVDVGPPTLFLSVPSSPSTSPPSSPSSPTSPTAPGLAMRPAPSLPRGGSDDLRRSVLRRSVGASSSAEAGAGVMSIRSPPSGSSVARAAAAVSREEAEAGSDSPVGAALLNRKSALRGSDSPQGHALLARKAEADARRRVDALMARQGGDL